MKRPIDANPRTSREGRSRRGYTLVEILTATVLMIIIMMAVTVIFASVTDSIGQSRATLEMSQRLRATSAILKQDLENVTPVMSPPVHPRDNSGYFQYVEGPIGPVVHPSAVAWNSELNIADTSVGDMDDKLLFTATTKGEPYVGLINGVPATSNSAEIIWFVRGHTLYRRVLLIKPDVRVREVNPAGFYARYDLSVRKAWDEESVPPVAPVGPPYSSGQHRPVLAANSLADLTKPECRFAHQPDMRGWRVDIAGSAATGPAPTPVTGVGLTPKLQKSNGNLRYRNEPKPFLYFLRPWLGAPYDADLANISANFKWVPGLGLPILAECSAPNWAAGDFPPTENLAGVDLNSGAWVQMPQFSQPVVPTGPFDAWANEHPWTQVDPLTGILNDYSGGGRNDDVILTNVIGFDVKAWDPNAPVFTHGPTANPLNQYVVLSPGDPGYANEVIAMRNAIASNTAFPIPALGAYADLNYMATVPYNIAVAGGPAYPDAAAAGIPAPFFHRQGYPLYPDVMSQPLAANRSMAYGTRWQFAVNQQPYCYFPAVYDTWSLHYEYNQQSVHYFSPNPNNTNYVEVTIGDEDGNGIYDQGTNDYDDNGANGVDDIGERETQPPYGVPLQGIQVRLRVFEPGSRQVREVTIIQKFKTK